MPSEGLTVSIEGFRELHDALGEFTKATEKALLRRVAKKALQPFVDRARQLAPVDEGNLRDSITIGTKLTRSAKRAAKADPIEGVRVFAGTSDRNGVPREYGSTRSRAEPFMRPAWAGTGGAVLDVVTSELATEIEKTRVRVARRAAKRG